MKKSYKGVPSRIGSGNLIDIKLKDGRRLFTTHNNFKKFVEDKKGRIIPVTDTYFKNCLKLPYLDE